MSSSVNVEYGYITAHCDGMSVRWMMTGSMPVGDALEQGLGRLHRNWVEVDTIFWSTTWIRVEWHTTNNWKIPLSRLWDMDTREIHFYFNMRVAGMITQSRWEPIYRQWIDTRDRIWSSHYQAEQVNEWGMRPHIRHHVVPGNHSRHAVRQPGVSSPWGTRTTDVISNTMIPQTMPVISWVHLLRNLNPLLGRDLGLEENGLFREVNIQFLQPGSFFETQPQHISLEELDEIAPIYSYNTSDETEPLICAITQNEITAGTEVRQLPCQHIFVASAIEQWLTSRNNRCPVCRQTVSSQTETESNASGEN
jgi:hypothetical protein